MERLARLVLWRLSPPFRQAVEVRRITVGGFLDLVRLVAPRAAASIVASGKPLTDAQLIHACADADILAAFADLVTVDRPVGYLRGWLDGRLGGAFARRNTDALLRACRSVEGDGQWTRFLGCLNRGPSAGEARKPKADRGGLAQDIVTLCQMGLGRYADLLGMPLQDFLNLCEAVNVGARMGGVSDPTLDPDVEPSDSIPIAGLWQVH